MASGYAARILTTRTDEHTSSPKLITTTIMGELYEKYSKLFHVESVPVKIDNSALAAKTLGLLILGKFNQTSLY